MSTFSGYFSRIDTAPSERFISDSGSSAPEVTRDGQVTLLMDGWLANRRRLREQLTSQGHSFASERDSELALACYERHGIEAFSMLDGAFGLAIHDGRTAELILVRDRVGQVPVFYLEEPDRVLFASDLTAVAQGASSSLPMSQQAVEAYLQLTYIPTPLTIHEGVYKLLPGSFLRVGPDGVSAPTTYWDIDYNDSNQIQDRGRCQQMVRDALVESVDQALETSGNVGALLSGGIDSTIITGIAATVLGKKLPTFSISFTDRRYDESARATLASDFHKTNHQLIPLDFDEPLAELAQLLDNLDQPYADSSYLPATMVARAAKQEVDTVVTGDAGDELFAGYSKYLIGHYSDKFNKVPRWVSGPAIKGANLALPVGSQLRRKINKVADSAQLPPFEQRERLMSLGFTRDQLQTLLVRPPHGVASKMAEGYYNHFADNIDEMRRALYLDFKVVLDGDMMTKGQNVGRASGLRINIPMLSHQVMETAAQIPSDYKISGGVTKAILRETFSDLIPESLLHASKQGFSMPLDAWLRHGLRSSLLDMLSEERIRDQGLLHYPAVRRLLDEHLSGKADHSSKLWALYVLIYWLDAHGR